MKRTPASQAEAGRTEDTYRELFESSPRPMWVYDAETLRVLAVNPAGQRLCGYPHPEFLELCVTDLLESPEAAAAFLETAARAKTAPHAPSWWRYRKKDGTLFMVEARCEHVHFQHHRAVLVMSCDRPERGRAQQHAEAFSNLGRRLSAARTAREAGLIILETADRLFGWDACVLDLCRPDHKLMDTVFCIDTIEGRRQECEAPACEPGPLLRRTLDHGAQLILRGTSEKHPPGVIPFGDRDRPSSSLMYVPIRQDAKPIGVLSIQSYSVQAYTREDLSTLQALADHCAGALERIRAEEELRRLNAELEQRVASRTAQLEAINQELEAFSYSVSHDLRAPLRSIRGFSEAVLERYAAHLDPRGQEFLRRASQSCQHMDKLIEALLQMSRVGRAELQHQRVNLSVLAEAVLAELRKAEPERAVDCVIEPGLEAVGDERLLRLVLHNLLGNAWKFTRDQPRPRIEFGLVLDPQPAFFVRDNGAGFDMTYAGKLFGAFQRLHTTSEFPGTGVGLATVQRILNRHGGRIWAAAEVNRGATFFFTLPEAEDPQGPGIRSS